MADNIDVTAGAGKTVATDDVSGVHYQKIKMDGGGDGATIPLVAGRQADAASLPVALSTENAALVGALTETAPGTDTASSGLNGRLQRVSQRLTSLIALLPASLGSKAEAASLAVTLSTEDVAKIDGIESSLTSILAAVDGVEAALAPLALESGGNLAAIAASASVLDDWDESDRAKVNIVVGQAGVSAGAGAVAANTPRMTLASDDPAVAVLGATSGTKVITDANGTVQQYLRGIVYYILTYFLPRFDPANFVKGLTSAMTGTTSTSLLSAPGASLYNYITEIAVSNSHATVGTDIELQDGSGGTTFWVLPAAAVYGGAVIHFDPPLKQPTSNTALYVKNTTTGASTRVSANGYKGA